MFDERHLKELDYGITCAIGAFIEAMGMMSENLQRVHLGQSIAYPEEAFNKLMEERGLHHNGIWNLRPID